MEKKIYIVRGNHDGTIGAYSNIKRAYVAAVNYTGAESVLCYVIEDAVVYKPATYSKVVYEFKGKAYAQVELYSDDTEETIAYIELFYLND